MNTTKRLSILIIALLPMAAVAHEGHSHGPEQPDTVATGPVTLTDEAIKNLEIKSIEANLAPLQRTMTMIGRIEGLPERQAKISPRAEGRVAEIMAKLGDRVTAGQPLLRFEPRTVGNPPVVLTSPINGFVVRQDTSLGSSLTPETVVMEVADYSQVLARGMTFESPDLALIKPGQDARVRLAVFGDRIFQGKVQRLDVGLERESRTFEVYVLLENPELQLRPNMQASVSIAIGEAQEVLAVPQSAVLGDLGNLFVFVRDGNTFERRNVVVGMKAGDQVEIMEGVLPTEQVVTQGNYQLQFAPGAPKPAAEAKPAEEAAGHADDGHAHGVTASSVSLFKRVPAWMWAIVGFAAGLLVLPVLRRRPARQI